jgi:hypothetical protein
MKIKSSKVGSRRDGVMVYSLLQFARGKTPLSC